MRSYVILLAPALLLLAGCSAPAVAEPSEREIACEGLYDFNDEHGAKFGSASASEVAGLATKLADSTGTASDFIALRAAAKLVAQTAVDPSTASQMEIDMYSSAMKDLTAQLSNAQETCSA